MATTDRVTGVIVFDGRPKGFAVVRPKRLAGALVVSTTGPRGAGGAQGEPGPVYDPDVHDLSTLFRNGRTR